MNTDDLQPPITAFNFLFRQGHGLARPSARGELNFSPLTSLVARRCARLARRLLRALPRGAESCDFDAKISAAGWGDALQAGQVVRMA